MLGRDIIKTIKNKEMDRKDFLKYSGLVALGVFGLKGVTSFLLQSDKKLTVVDTKNESRRGFGGGKYGV